MEFRFDVRTLLPDEITLVDNNLIIGDWKSTTKNRVEYQELYQIINAIGEASSFAQGLNNVITTADKLQTSDHLLYLMKEEDESIGQCLLVGMLKIGRKKLFLLDTSQRTKECAPLCVLDFYIHESRQRRGYGRRLFDYMLRDQNVLPGHMAVDKPSDKFLGFLRKHYNLYKQVSQINNFVVFDAFFTDRPIVSEEAALTYVSRSPRAVSPDGSHSQSASRRSSTSSYCHSAGRPSNSSRQANSMVDILHGRPDRHSTTARLAPRYQTTLEPTSRKDSVDQVDGNRSLEGSFAPTPATSPERHSPAKDGEDVIDQQPSVEEDGMVEKVEKLSMSAGPQSPVKSPELCGLVSLCKTSQWRDSVSRPSTSLAERMSAPSGSTMTGVLHENESVHGHLKFHHHALW
ncbi:alpha-tubulin N-acetyltransferase-like isoform X3 [Homarus americanus]|uniref:alpha-tubulin N-acetyltransferase-like isoform X3 n=1 Tax=Homarus americanus TaxID=6706 RepID=UPI001C4381BC|nr:alpha-tubulin N-acetyltransferase-like isoform X3 [Homarus americanus]